MSSRVIVGSLSVLLFFREFIDINRIPFDYHYHPEDAESINFKKGSYLLTFKYFQHVLNKYQNPKIGDLVAFEMPDRSMKLCLVEAIPRSYFWDPNASIEYYVPAGFIVLKDPLTAQTKMECIGSVRGNQHYLIPF